MCRILKKGGIIVFSDWLQQEDLDLKQQEKLIEVKKKYNLKTLPTFSLYTDTFKQQGLVKVHASHDKGEQFKNHFGYLLY